MLNDEKTKTKRKYTKKVKINELKSDGLKTDELKTDGLKMDELNEKEEIIRKPDNSFFDKLIDNDSYNNSYANIDDIFYREIINESIRLEKERLEKERLEKKIFEEEILERKLLEEKRLERERLERLENIEKKKISVRNFYGKIKLYFTLNNDEKDAKNFIINTLEDYFELKCEYCHVDEIMYEKIFYIINTIHKIFIGKKYDEEIINNEYIVLKNIFLC
jgi:hypothetical protein